MFSEYRSGVQYPFIRLPAYVSPLNNIQNREEYLEKKSLELKIGASQIADIVGLGHQTANKLYRLKKFREKPKSNWMRDELTAAGEKSEPIAMGVFVDYVIPEICLNGDNLKFVKGFMVCTQEHQYLACTPDYFLVNDDEFLGLEIKSPQIKDVPMRAEDIPVNHIMQCVQCMFVLKKPSWFLFYYKMVDHNTIQAALYNIYYNEELMNMLIVYANRFIELVQSDAPYNKKFQIRVKQYVKDYFTELARKTNIQTRCSLTSLRLSTSNPQTPPQ